jgi:glycosyltransferase involved in cell wall biosynthesis
VRVALLTNFIPPYRVPLYEALTREVGELRVFVSTAMEANRRWQPVVGELDVVQQRTITLRRLWRTPAFTEPYELHIPYDTVSQLRRWRADVIMTGEMGARSLQAVFFARASRTPVVLWALLSDRLENGRGLLRQAARRWIMSNVDSIIVNGENGARYFKHFGVPDARLLRLNQAIDMQALLKLPLQQELEGAHRLLYVGTLSERKGVQLLLEAIDQWAGANPSHSVELVLVGDGPLRADLRKRKSQPNVKLEWAGAIPYEDLPRWYGSGGILLFPSLGDEWGLVVNEALAAGVPVMGSAYSGAVEELIRDGINGWVFLPEDVTAVVAALDRVLTTDAEQIHRMRSAARLSVQHLTPAAAARRIAERLREVAGK